MSGPAGVPAAAGATISVRGEARELVTPDQGVLSCALTTVAADKGAALRDLAAAVERVTGALAEHGAVPLDLHSARSAVTWSLRATSSEAEHAPDGRTGAWAPTGRLVARARLDVAVRDLVQLNRVGAVLARFEALQVEAVQWLVDHDNPAWPRVRSAAVLAAVQRARDYAAALGGTVVTLDQVADVGLLAAQDGVAARAASGWQPQVFMSESGPAAPSLDPVPQEVWAHVDARFTATGLTLP